MVASCDEETRPQLTITTGHSANLVHQVGGIVELSGRIVTNHDFANDDGLNVQLGPSSGVETKGFRVDKLNAQFGGVVSNILINVGGRADIPFSIALIAPVFCVGDAVRVLMGKNFKIYIKMVLF